MHYLLAFPYFLICQTARDPSSLAGTVVDTGLTRLFHGEVIELVDMKRRERFAQRGNK
jgi:hypothetical protein